jgi:DNA-directed RNA polymerase subunit RPC12/RpoP
MIHKKFVCINCKLEFDEMPPKRNNECIRGYYHDFVKTTCIIKR